MKHEDNNNTQTPDITLTDHTRALALLAALFSIKPNEDE